MNGEPIPDLATDFLTKHIGQGFALVRVEIVHDQVNRRGSRVLHGYFAGEPRELKRGSIRGGRGEVVARLGLHRAENISRASILAFLENQAFLRSIGISEIRLAGCAPALIRQFASLIDLPLAWNCSACERSDFLNICPTRCSNILSASSVSVAVSSSTRAVSVA
jgi:hypothetical protein